MAALKHDHIVTIYQVGQQHGVPFLAMEYLRGMSLYNWLDRGHKPAVDLVLRLGREIAAGLAAAHQRGLVHRDIKPANIWLEAPSGRVKILDFGLARAEGHDVQITNPGTTVGSPAYMAPEQARGEGGDASSDLFSLGCVLYLLCTRRLPFPGTTVVAVLTSLATDTPPAPRELNPAIPASLDELIMQLLAKRPADRPASARAVVEAIRSIERDLQAERPRAELAPAAPPPVVADPSERTRDGVAREPGAPAPRRRLAASDVRSRSPRRSSWWGRSRSRYGSIFAPEVPRRSRRVLGRRRSSPCPVRARRSRDLGRLRARRSRSLQPDPQGRRPRRSRSRSATRVAAARRPSSIGLVKRAR